MTDEPMTTETPTPGAYTGVSFEQYFLWDAANHSLLKQYRKTPAHADHYRRFGDTPTAAMDVGTATHAALLEPNLFARDFVAMPTFDGHHASNKHKQAKAEWLNANKDKITLAEADMQQALACQAAAMAHPIARELLTAPGANELSCVWTDPTTGLTCKTRADRMIRYQGVSTVVDIKTTINGDPDSWPREIAKYSYHTQAAIELAALNTLQPAARQYLFIVLDKGGKGDPPALCAVYSLEEDARLEGDRLVKRWLGQHKRCVDSGEWPGYPPSIMPVSIPTWAFKMGDMPED